MHSNSYWNYMIPPVVVSFSLLVSIQTVFIDQSNHKKI